MKVLMTSDAVGGVWTYALELAGALAEDGVEVVLATMGPPPKQHQRQEAAALGNVLLECGDFKLEWMEDPWEDVRLAGQWLLELEQAHHPNLIHLNGYAHGTLPWAAPVLMVAHSCVLSWWEAVKGEPIPPQWSRYRHVVASGLASADCVVAPSAQMLEMAQRHYGPLPRTLVIHNARDPARCPAGKKEPLILTAGRMWDEAKNLAALAAIAPELHWPVYVAGSSQADANSSGQLPQTGDDGSPRDELSAGPIRFLGPLPAADLAGWMSRAAIYALPARYEPFGLSILEAALAGCALVLGDIPSLREIWGDAALFIAPDDHDGLRQAINALINDPDRQGALADRAQQRAMAYTPRRMADAYLAQYRRLHALMHITDPILPGVSPFLEQPRISAAAVK